MLGDTNRGIRGNGPNQPGQGFRVPEAVPVRNIDLGTAFRNMLFPILFRKRLNGLFASAGFMAGDNMTCRIAVKDGFDVENRPDGRRKTADTAGPFKEIEIIHGKILTGMRDLCTRADVIMPNITEAVFMLGEEYRPGPYTEEYIEGLLRRLSALGPKKVILTGVHFDSVKLGAACYDAGTGRTKYFFRDRIPGYYHGTGDIFGSVIVASVMNGLTLARATELAVDFTWRSIVRTHDAGTDVRFGVNFEAGFPRLLDDMGLRKD